MGCKTFVMVRSGPSGPRLEPRTYAALRSGVNTTGSFRIA